MFAYCSELKSLDISNFTSENVTTMSTMFCMCRKLEYIDMSSFDIKDANSASITMFLNMPDTAIIKVKDAINQNTVLNGDNAHPSSWTIDNVIIKEA